mmetsp:Transcript_1105/g.2405  ORF Transcript_1105/g.2405 Transcript_1105/m.2405 type:complete len:213 (+) Transcript_1105:947-1585(+)
MVWATPHMHHHTEQGVHHISAHGIRCCVAELQFKREDNPVHQLAHPALCLNVLEALKVQDEACRRLLDEHALLRLLQAAAVVAEELVILVQHLHGAEVAQAACEGAVLVDLQAKVHEHLLTVRHRLAVQAACLIDKLSLKDLMHPCSDGGLPWTRCATPSLLLLLLKYLTCLVQQVVEELMRILMHVAAEQFVISFQPLDKLLGGIDTRPLL